MKSLGWRIPWIKNVKVRLICTSWDMETSGIGKLSIQYTVCYQANQKQKTQCKTILLLVTTHPKTSQRLYAVRLRDIGMPSNLVISAHKHILSFLVILCQPGDCRVSISTNLLNPPGPTACYWWRIDSYRSAAACDHLPISMQMHSPQGTQSSGTSKLWCWCISKLEIMLLLLSYCFQMFFCILICFTLIMLLTATKLLVGFPS